jgi:putative copper resistance protein D
LFEEKGLVYLLQILFLYVHLVSAVVFVGGSIFIWTVLLPAMNRLEVEQSTKQSVLFAVSKRFGRVVDVSLLLLIVTGIYNATWYLPSFEVSSPESKILAIKIIVVAIMVFSIYFNNLYYAKKIVSLTKQVRQLGPSQRTDELVKKLGVVRRRSRVLSTVNMALMLLVILLAVMLQFPP